MAETKIDMKLYLSGTSAVEQGLGSLYSRLEKAHEATEAFNKNLGKQAEVLEQSFEQAGKAVGKLGLDNLGRALDGIGKLVGQTSAAVGALNQTFTVLTGRSLVGVVAGLQQLTVHSGSAATAMYVLGTATTSATSALQLLGGAIAVAGAAFVGWQVGKVIGDLEVFGMTINERVTVVMLEAMKIWAQFQHTFGFMDDDEFGARMGALNKSSYDLLFPGKPAEANGEAPAPAPVDEPSPGPSPLKTLDESKQRADEQRLIKSVDALTFADADALKKVQIEKEKRDIAELERVYREATNVYETTLNERLAKLEETAAKEEAIMVQRAKAERATLQLREDAVAREISELERVQNRTTAQNAELNELKAEKQKLFGEGMAMELRQEQELQELTARTQERRVALYREAQAQIDALNKAKTEAAQTAAKSELDQLAAKLKEEMDTLTRQREEVEKDFRKTNAAKRGENIRLLQREADLMDEQIHKLERLARLQKDPGAKKMVTDKLGEARSKRTAIGGKQRNQQLAEDPKSLGDQMSKVLVKLQNETKSLAENIAGLFQGIVGAAIDSTAQSITGLIKGTMTWGQALQNIGDSILNSIISSFAKMAAQWIVNQIMMWTVGKALQAASMASSATAAAATTAMWSGPATLVTIATFGSMAAAAPGLVLGAAGATAGLMEGFSTASNVTAVAGASAQGGLITGPGTGTSDSIPMWLSNGEFVIPAAKVAEFGTGFFEGIRTGSLSPRDLSGGGVQRAGVPAVNLQGMAPSVNVQSAQPKVIVVNSQEELMKVMKGSIGEEITVAHIAKNKLRLGMAS